MQYNFLVLCLLSYNDDNIKNKKGKEKDVAEKEPWDKEIYKAMKADSEKVVRAASQEKTQ